MRTWGLPHFLFAAVLALGGCALSPSSEEAAAFGKAAGVVAEKLSDASAADSELARLSYVDAQACRYIRGSSPNFKVPKEYGISRNLKDQSDFLDAVAEYAHGLSLATDDAGIEALEKNADKFAVALAGFGEEVVTIGGAPAPSKWPVVKPALQIVSLVGVNVAEYEYRNRIRNIAQAVEPILVAGATKIIIDNQKSMSELNNRYAEWQSSRSCVLSRMNRRDPVAYDEFVKSYDLSEKYAGRMRILGKLGSGLAALLVAHRDLIDGSETDIKRSTSLVESISLNLKTISDNL